MKTSIEQRVEALERAQPPARPVVIILAPYGSTDESEWTTMAPSWTPTEEEASSAPEDLGGK